MKFNLLLVIALPILLTACGGSIYTSDKVTSEQDVQGVIYYPPILNRQVSYTTVAKDEKGNVVGDEVGSSAAGGKKCIPVRTEKIVTMPDYAHPKRIYYKAGIFESPTFGVTLDSSGLLTAVNSASKQDQGQSLLNAANALGALTTAGVFSFTKNLNNTKKEPTVACNDGVVIESITPYVNR